LADSDELDRLNKLDAKLKAARQDETPQNAGAGHYGAVTLAWRMVIDMIVGLAVGVGMGYGLDVLFGTKPIFILIFAVLGITAGIRTALRSAEQTFEAEKTAENEE